MRKKIVHILLGSAMVVMLTGCGQKKEDAVVTLTPAVDAVTPTEAAAPTEAVATSDTPDATALAETAAPEDTAEAAVQDSDALLSQDYVICFANLTGRDIVKLQITFQPGDIVNLEVLGEKRLYDGEQFTFQSSSLDSLRGATRLKMSVTATAKDTTVTKQETEVMYFPEIDVLDPAHTDVILTSSEDGWRMYLQ